MMDRPPYRVADEGADLNEYVRIIGVELTGTAHHPNAGAVTEELEMFSCKHSIRVAWSDGDRYFPSPPGPWATVTLHTNRGDRQVTINLTTGAAAQGGVRL